MPYAHMYALGTKSRLNVWHSFSYYYFFRIFILPAGSFAFEVTLRKSVSISLIAVSGRVHKDRLKQHPCEKAFVGLG